MSGRPHQHHRRRSSRAAAFGICAVLAATPLSALAASFALDARGSAVGAVQSHRVVGLDTLMDIGRRYDLGFTQLLAANRGVNPWAPGDGQSIRVPSFYLLPDAPRRGIVVNLAEQRIYYFPPGKAIVETFPIGLGVQGASTPIGATRIVAKEANPVWYPPPSIREERPELPEAIAAGPNNPLGAYAFRLGWPNYLIHGTNKPDGVGRNVSHGCLHLYPEDIEQLFKELPVNTPVLVVDQPVKAAWIGDELFLEIHPTKDQGDELDIDNRMTVVPPPDDLEQLVSGAAGDSLNRVDWSAVRQVGLDRSGIPTLIATRSH